jgi:hypothetical protein
MPICCDSGWRRWAGLVRLYGIDPALLVAGVNVLAVEVHQAAATHRLSFDARLTALAELILAKQTTWIPI